MTPRGFITLTFPRDRTRIVRTVAVDEIKAYWDGPIDSADPDGPRTQVLFKGTPAFTNSYVVVETSGEITKLIKETQEC